MQKEHVGLFHMMDVENVHGNCLPVSVGGLLSALSGWMFISTSPVIMVFRVSLHEIRQSIVEKNDGVGKGYIFFLDLLKILQQIGAWNGNLFTWIKEHQKTGNGIDNRE